jgi:hypothetical protein
MRSDPQQPLPRRSGRSFNTAAASRRGNHRLKNAMLTTGTAYDPHRTENLALQRLDNKTGTP